VPKWMPSAPEIARETIIVLGGALVAAAIVGAFPQLRDWIRSQWSDAPH
jgi:hypothetical protein